MAFEGLTALEELDRQVAELEVQIQARHRSSVLSRRLGNLLRRRHVNVATVALANNAGQQECAHRPGAAGA